MTNAVISDGFISACAEGQDWRDAAKKILDALGTLPSGANAYTLGFVYISDDLTADAQSILTLLRSVTRIEHWTGAVGFGVCGNGAEYVDRPAISVMLARIPPDKFRIFPPVDINNEPARAVLEPWQEEHNPMLVLVHGDPAGDTDPALALAGLEQVTGGYIAGGLSASRSAQIHVADEIFQGGVSGVAFAQEIEVASMITQGCAPIGPVHTVTRCEDHIVMELDGQRAFDIFAGDLRAMATVHAAKHGLPEGAVESENLFRGEVHVAFPVAGSEKRDYQVRNALGIDPDKGWIAVAQKVLNGEQMMFVHRDDETVRADLSRALVDLRARITGERAVFAPRGALYISCVARTGTDFGGEKGEMALVREILGDVPLAGFYAGGEISNRRIYSYTAVLILFL